MATSPRPLSFDGESPFRYVGGDPSLDLVNTVDWTDRGLENDRLTDYDRLTRWAEGASVLSAADARRLRAVASDDARAARTALEAARRLRSLLHGVVTAVARGTSPDRELGEFNAVLTRALARAEVAPAPHRAGPGALIWAWRGWGEHLESVLWPVAWSAASLLVSADAQRLRVCGGPACGWVYVDRSRNGFRRWCQMETCGTREKNRRRAAAGVRARRRRA
jgi:predicted RNA-binding Zn ribbon-like protein